MCEERKKARGGKGGRGGEEGKEAADGETVLVFVKEMKDPLEIFLCLCSRRVFVLIRSQGIV